MEPLRHGRAAGYALRLGSRMNRAKVIVLMTAAVFVTLAMVMVFATGGFPPWPVWLWFTASHVFFCVVVARVRTYTGPYVQPLGEITAANWKDPA